MPRKRPISENQYKEKLEQQGWHTTFIPSTPGLFDILAFKPAYYTIDHPKKPTAHKITAWEIKERNGDYLYIDEDKISRINRWSNETGIPVRLAVKWKNGRGRKPDWWTGKIRHSIKRRECLDSANK